MPTLTIVKEDRAVIVDGFYLDSCDVSGLPDNVHAVQWDGTTGHVELTDGDNVALTSISAYQSIIDEHATKKAELETAIENAQVSDIDKIRRIRNWLLQASDWTQMSDSPLSSSDKTAWATYRTNLRNLTDTYTSLDDVVWPTAPDNSLDHITDSIDY